MMSEPEMRSQIPWYGCAVKATPVRGGYSIVVGGEYVGSVEPSFDDSFVFVGVNEMKPLGQMALAELQEFLSVADKRAKADLSAFPRFWEGTGSFIATNGDSSNDLPHAHFTLTNGCSKLGVVRWSKTTQGYRFYVLVGVLSLQEMKNTVDFLKFITMKDKEVNE